jgi:hypothetical protein
VTIAARCLSAQPEELAEIIRTCRNQATEQVAGWLSGDAAVPER